MAGSKVQPAKKLVKAAWLALVFNAPPPWELVRWDIVEQTGWTLEYVDALDVNEVYKRSDILTARAKARDK